MPGMDCKIYFSKLGCKRSDRQQNVKELFQWVKGGLLFAFA